MNIIFNFSENIFTRNTINTQEFIKVMNDFNEVKSKGKKPKKEQLPQKKFEVRSNELIKNRKERDFTGSYCKETFKKHKAWKQSLSREDFEENESGLLIEKPKETYKTFNSIELYDVIGCVKASRPHYPKAYLVVEKNKDEERLTVIPWQASWLEQEHTKDTLRNHYQEYFHQNKSLNIDNKLKIEDISLSVSLERFVKLYKLDRTINKFIVPSEETRKVRLVRFIQQESDAAS